MTFSNKDPYWAVNAMHIVIFIVCFHFSLYMDSIKKELFISLIADYSIDFVHKW